MAYTLAPIHRMKTESISLNGDVVGYLCPPDAFDPQWEIWARQGCASQMPAGLSDAGLGRYPTRDAALAFLGLLGEQERAAA